MSACCRAADVQLEHLVVVVGARLCMLLFIIFLSYTH